jgi:DNA-directed RNA polymerase specialized sigma24 family protein
MLERLSVTELAGRCHAETERYLDGEFAVDHFCMELFRRAVALRDEAAWACLYEQYADMVRHWLGARHDAALDAMVSVVFTRFWKAVDAAKFLHFASLASVLQYLKMCARATLLDEARRASVAAVEQSLDDIPWDLATPAVVETDVAEHLDSAAFWTQIQGILTDERERLVIQLTFVFGLRPREICRLYASVFPEIDEVYRLKRSALDRLRRELRLYARREAQ